MQIAISHPNVVCVLLYTLQLISITESCFNRFLLSLMGLNPEIRILQVGLRKTKLGHYIFLGWIIPLK